MCQKCGCNTCETDGTALMLNESKASRTILSEGLKHHIDTNRPLINNFYSAGSRDYFDLIAEARSLYSRGILEITNKRDIELLTETDQGYFGIYEGKKVPLDFPMVNEEKELKKGDKIKLKLKNGKEFEVTFDSYSKTDGIGYMKYIDKDGDPVRGTFSLNSIVSGKINEKEGVPHYTKDGKEWKGKVHKMPNGKLMTQNPHNEDSEELFHKEDLKENNLLRQTNLSSEEYQKAKKLKGFNADDYTFSSDNNLYVKEKKSKFKKHGEMSGFDMRGIDEEIVDYDFSEKELIRVIKQLKNGASGEIGIIKAFEKALGRELTDDEIRGFKIDPSKVGRASLEETISEWPKELTSRYSDEYRFELEKVTPTYQDKPGRAKYRVIDIESGELKGTPVFGTPESLMAFADDLIKPQGGTQSTNLGESLEERIVNILEAKKKKDPPLNKPKRGGSKAYYVYVRDPKTKKIKKVSFGSGGLRAKIKNKQARNAFAARHKCSTKKDRTKAGYWSCNLPRYADQLGLGSKMNTFW